MKKPAQAALACAMLLESAGGGRSAGTVLPATNGLALYSAATQQGISASPDALTFTGTGAAKAQTFSVSVRGQGALTATSSNPQVATVDPGTQQAAAIGGGVKSATFTVTPIAPGTCTVSVNDKKGSAASVSVTVTLPAASISVRNEYQIPTNDTIYGIANGPNGSVWFTQWASGSIAQLSAAGLESSSALDGGAYTSSKPYGIAYGSDGDYWVADYSNHRIVQVGPTGTILNSYPTQYAPMHITSGPDGNLWFTQEDSSGNTGFSEVVKLATTGAMTHYPTSAAAQAARSYAYDIASGPDGRMWFTEGSTIGAITTSGAMTEYPIASGEQSHNLVSGGDGNLWFTEPNADRVGRMSISGVSRDFCVTTPFSMPWAIAAGKDGAAWFTESAGGQIGRAAADGTITEYPVTGLTGQSAILSGSDGNLWVTSYSGEMIVISY